LITVEAKVAVKSGAARLVDESDEKNDFKEPKAKVFTKSDNA
jgi:hypothetical protein